MFCCAQNAWKGFRSGSHLSCPQGGRNVWVSAWNSSTQEVLGKTPLHSFKMAQTFSLFNWGYDFHLLTHNEDVQQTIPDSAAYLSVSIMDPWFKLSKSPFINIHNASFQIRCSLLFWMRETDQVCERYASVPFNIMSIRCVVDAVL